MFDWFRDFFSSTSFMPHGHCYLWRPDILWLNVGADLLIAGSYYSIPASLIYLVRRRRDLAFNWIFTMFAAFILACGTTHLIDIWTVWIPNYGMEGVVKMATGLISVATAIALWILMPKALAIPSANDLEVVNESLRREIADRRSAEEGERQSEQRFKLLVEGVNDYAIIMLDPEGRVSTWNAGAELITGYSEREISGQHFSKFYRSEDISQNLPQQEIEAAKRDGKYEEEGLRVRKSGEVFWASVVLTTLRDQKGTLTGFVKITRDITERHLAAHKMRRLNEDLESRVAQRTLELKEREQLLMAREQHLKLITDSLPALVSYLDRDLHFVSHNKAYEKWFGPMFADVVGKHLSLVVGPETYRDLEPKLMRAFAGESLNFEYSLVDQAGAVMHLEINYIPDQDHEGVVRGVIALVSDMTHRKSTEVEIRNAKEAAEAANNAKSAFLANMSHEIRTPLGAVVGFSELLINPNQSPSDKVSAVDAIKRNGELLSNIVNDILDLSKIEAGRLEIDKSWILLKEVVSDLGALLNLKAAEKGLKLRVEGKGQLPLRIETDRLRLRQILMNVVGNAVKFTEKGSVDIAIEMREAPHGKRLLAFVVEDTGPGISDHQVGRLFKPFAQADHSTTRKFGGTGLGLVLAKRLARELGGDVLLTDSIIGKGSVFSITIDPGSVSEFSQSMFQSDPESTSVQTIKMAYPIDLTGIKILLVEDAIDNQILLARILKLAGASVDIATNGREGVDKVLGADYDIILMDLQMPEMDGFEATALLRSKGITKPIVALTAHALKEDRILCLERGFTEHMTKPIDRQKLLLTIRQLV